MDTGAQKMKPSGTDEDRKITARIFANATYDGTARINSYEPMLPYLNGNLIKILHGKLPRTATAKEYVSAGQYSDRLGEFNVVSVYGASDAKLYLEWLISVVRGSEKVSEDLRNEAYDQLDRFVLALRDVTNYNKEIVLMKPHDWVARLEKFEDEISESLLELLREIHDSMDFWDTNVQGYSNQLDKIIEMLDDKTDALSKASEKQMNDVAKMLESILKWMEKYSPILDGIEKDYKALHPTKVKKR
jgi:hypothetical protein